MRTLSWSRDIGAVVDSLQSPFPSARERAAHGRVNRGVFQPIRANVAAYNDLYAEYRALHDHFGRGGNDVMSRLKAIRRKALQGPAS